VIGRKQKTLTGTDSKINWRMKKRRREKLKLI
jgi:hypothetical protein